MGILENRCALVTGANGGIGRAIVEAFACEGCKIYAHARCEKAEFTEFLANVSKEKNVEICPIYFDLTDYEQTKNEIRKLIKDKVKIDILVNNAGIAHGGLISMTSISQIKDIFEVNFFSMINMIQLISRIMTRNKYGSIINMASISGLELDAGNCAYGTSKAAVIALTKTISKELAPTGVRVNAIAPGLTDTRMATMMEEKAGENMVRDTAINRLAKPGEIADAAVYLASDKSSFVTGQVIRVDGGM